MLDAMVRGYPGCRRFRGTSVERTLAELERRKDIEGLRVAYVSGLAGIGMETEIDSICRGARPRWQNSARKSRKSRST